MSEFFYNLASGALGLLPNLDFSIPEQVKTTFFDIIKGVTYFFPIKLCMPIIYVSLALISVRIGLVIYKFIKSHIPNMS